MRSWRLTAGFANGQYATAPQTDQPYSNDFETDDHGFSGSWTRTNKWAKSGTYSLGSTNQGQPNTTSKSTLSTSMARAGRLSFSAYAQCEAGSDGMYVNANGTDYTAPDYTVVGAAPTFSTAEGHYMFGSLAGAEVKGNKLLKSGNLLLEVGFRKDGSVDSGFDMGFIDDIKVEYLDIPVHADATYYQDFEAGVGDFTGDWLPSTEWALLGTKSLGRTNKGVQSSTSTALFSRLLTEASIVEFYFFTQGESNIDGLRLVVNGVYAALADITVIQGTISVTGTLVNSVDGVWAKFSKQVPAGSLNISFAYTKDQSADVGLDGAFIDAFTIYPAPAPTQNLSLVSVGNNGTGSPDFWELTDSNRTFIVKQNANVGWWKAASEVAHGSGTGKWYFEVEVVSIDQSNAGYVGGVALGLAVQGVSTDLGGGNAGDGSRLQYFGSAQKRSGGSYSAYGVAFNQGDTIGIGYDSGTGEIYTWRNGVANGLMFNANTELGSIPAMVPHLCFYYAASVSVKAILKNLPVGYQPWA